MLTLFLLAVSGWVPSSPQCVGLAIRRQIYVEAVRARKPDDLRYVRFPFPQTDEEVLADFKYAILEQGSHRGDDQQISEGVRRNAYRYEILRITSWSGDYCTEFHRSPSFLLRIFDRAGGVEVTRVTIDETGSPSCCVAPRNDLLPIPTIAEADRVLEMAHIRAAGAEYVYISRPWTESPYAAPHPYVAYRNDDGIYVVADDGLWFLPRDGQRLPFRTVFDAGKLHKALESMPRDAGPFSLSGDEFVVALPVDAP